MRFPLEADSRLGDETYLILAYSSLEENHLEPSMPLTSIRPVPRLRN